MTGEEYFMHDPREAKRLSDKVDAPAWASRYVNEFLTGPTRILDVGCGSGSIACAIAGKNPHSEVTGIDLYPERFQKTVRPTHVILKQGNAADIPFSDESFDLVICRFLLEYMKDKERAVSEMARVCKQGGTVLLQDLDGQMLWNYPADQELDKAVMTILKGMETTGFDPFAGRKLYSLAYTNNLSAICCSVEPYHVIAGRVDEFNLDLWKRKIAIATPAVSKIIGDGALVERAADLLINYFLRPDTFSYSTVITVQAKKLWSS